DSKLLYERYASRKRLDRRRKIMGILFLRIPLVTPDAFLGRTIRFVRPIFGRPFFIFWLCLIATAATLAARHADQLFHPAEGFLLARNIPLLWGVLIGLKLLHELGHAYACKHFGGYVPEMGAFLIVFTPCAYVDASSTWSFTRKRDRIIVCLAGMYIESICAAVAMMVWTTAPPGLLHDIAYNVIFLAGVVTVLFNINPLMRYDGYYVLSDLVEVPNLRQRSTDFVKRLLKRFALGLRGDDKPVTGRLAVLLACFGVAAIIYRVLVLVGITALLASKMFLVGLGFGLFLLGQTVVTAVRRLFQFLWFARETAPVRRRAVAVSCLLIIALPGLLLLVPMRSGVTVAGVVRGEQETTIRARTGGFVSRIGVCPGDVVEPGGLMVELQDDDIVEAVVAAQARIEVSRIRLGAFEVEDPTKAHEEREMAKVYQMELDRWQRDRSNLYVRSETGGVVLDCIEERELGRYVAPGDTVATVTRGRWQVRAVLGEEELADTTPKVGDRVGVRILAAPGETLRGIVTRVAPTGSRKVEAQSLTRMGGGDIAVDPRTGKANRPFFDLTIMLEDPKPLHLRYGMTCHVLLSGEATTLGMSIMRHTIRFTNALLQG
ncbi:MAG: HlyD family efflux transporter periplasmic adaptor subunit, partial [Candidatus Krumholzibacteriia bacterium]